MPFSGRAVASEALAAEDSTLLEVVKGLGTGASSEVMLTSFGSSVFCCIASRNLKIPEPTEMGSIAVESLVGAATTGVRAMTGPSNMLGVVCSFSIVSVGGLMVALSLSLPFALAARMSVLKTAVFAGSRVT